MKKVGKKNKLGGRNISVMIWKVISVEQYKEIPETTQKVIENIIKIKQMDKWVKYFSEMLQQKRP